MALSLESYVKKTEELLQKEREAEIEETRLLQENVSARELERRGVCLTRLRVSSTHTGLYGRTVLVFEPYWPGKDLPSHTFTPGDIAGLSLSQSDEDNESLGSGIISRVSPSTVSVAFDESYDSANIDDNSQYKLVKLANDVTYRRLKQALKNLNSYRGGPASRLIDVLFGEAELGPPYNTARDGKDAFDEDKLVLYNTRLDSSQKDAVKFALSAREMAIIHGPPGTGKTTTVVEIMLQAIKQGLKILVCAPSNVAVDNLVERLAAYKAKVIRLGHPARLMEDIQRLSLDAVLRHSEEAEVTEGIRQDMDKAASRLKKSTDRGEKQRLRNELRLMRKELREQESVAMKELLKRASVIAATLTSSTERGPLKHLGREHFDLVIIDECSQATEVSCWLGLLWGPKVILAGDHHQLPPTIISHEAAKEGLALTLMERQLDLHGEGSMRMLNVQYRMNAAIMTWASDQLYEGKLTAHSSVAQHLLKDLPTVSETEDTSSSLLLVDTAGCDLWELDVSDEVSKGNEGEVDLCVVHVERLIKAGLKAEEIAVIAPYNLQVELLRLKLAQKYPKLEIKSVDGFQGREKEAVVISLVRSNSKGVVGFLAEDRRINVAITRARRHLAVICDSETVGRHAFLRSLLDYMSQHGEVRSAQQYITEGDIDPSAKRPDYLQAKIDASRTSQSQKAKAPKSGKKKQAKEEVKSKQAPSKTIPPEKKASDIDIKSEEEELKEILTQFVLDDKRREHAFPPTLSSRQRFLVHEISEKLELTHISQGEGADRHIVVTKVNDVAKKTPKPTGDISASQNKPVVSRAGTKCSETSSESDFTRTKDQKTITKTDVSGPKNKPRDDDDDSRSQSKDVETTDHDIVTCSKCKKYIPRSNWTLHDLRCVAPVDKKAEAESTRPKPASAKNKKKKKKQNKTSEGGKQGEEEEDFDALIASVVAADTRCHVEKCKENAKTLGQNCQFCTKRFCIKHHMAEVHGCGAAAKSHARMMISREGVLYRGSGVPDKTTDPVKRAHLERKLAKKLDKLNDTRRPKTKEK